MYRLSLCIISFVYLKYKLVMYNFICLFSCKWQPIIINSCVLFTVFLYLCFMRIKLFISPTLVVVHLWVYLVSSFHRFPFVHICCCCRCLYPLVSLVSSSVNKVRWSRRSRRSPDRVSSSNQRVTLAVLPGCALSSVVTKATRRQQTWYENSSRMVWWEPTLFCWICWLV